MDGALTINGEPRFGPTPTRDGTAFRLWAPSLPAAELIIDGRAPVTIERAEGGFFSLAVAGAGPGTRYKFRAGEVTFPDLASRQQLDDADGWSVVRTPFPAGRSGPLRPWHETVICEVHVGAATPEGTFAALADRLEHFRDAGFTCLEIMPVNEFPGDRNWGYDGTLVFAPEHAYGPPEDLRRLVDRAHDLGLSMVLDVVYNHFGETANFVPGYAPEWFKQGETTPWGSAINFDEPMVRRFYCENAAMWLSEYDFDGLRFDSVHEVKTASRDLFLSELAAAATAAKPGCRLIIENVRNSFRWLERDAGNRPLYYLAQWNDDMHHVLAHLVAGEGRKTGYDDSSKDPYADLEKALADGFLHDPTEGDGSDGRTRGGAAAKLPPDSFITYVENHDQLGNRADARRLSDRIAPEQLDFLHFVKFLAPQIPLCFMGDEGNITSGFPFFFDLPTDVAERMADGRYQQMRDMFGEGRPAGRSAGSERSRHLPDGQADLERFPRSAGSTRGAGAVSDARRLAPRAALAPRRNALPQCAHRPPGQQPAGQLAVRSGDAIHGAQPHCRAGGAELSCRRERRPCRPIRAARRAAAVGWMVCRSVVALLEHGAQGDVTLGIVDALVGGWVELREQQSAKGNGYQHGGRGVAMALERARDTRWQQQQPDQRDQQKQE
jgi:maltooligosyltrehalose trehalohydrolase